MHIRPTQARDIAAMQTILTQTDLFPATLLPDMISGYLEEKETNAIWLTCEIDKNPAGFCYAVPEPLTDGTWNMLAIAVSPEQQGMGCGAALVTHLEQALSDKGGRIIFADTSGTENFHDTRRFCEKIGYTEEARIRDFWASGDDKVVYRKSLSV